MYSPIYLYRLWLNYMDKGTWIVSYTICGIEYSKYNTPTLSHVHLEEKLYFRSSRTCHHVELVERAAAYSYALPDFGGVRSTHRQFDITKVNINNNPLESKLNIKHRSRIGINKH